jgi:Type II secretion system protein C
MPKRLVALNLVLLAAAVFAVASIVRTLIEPAPRPALTRPRPAPPAPARAAESPSARAPGPGAYAVIASRNLFSPTRTEAPPTTAAAKAATALPKPNLYGVVLKDGTPIAYLEDPLTKRVAGYRLGDTIAGGTVQMIDSDHIILTRPDGQVDVRLRDPSRPRPPVPQATPAAPPTPPPVQGAIAPPGQPMPVPQPPVVQAPAIPQGQMPSPVPSWRSLPPNLLRRAPTGSPNDATPQR